MVSRVLKHVFFFFFCSERAWDVLENGHPCHSGKGELAVGGAAAPVGTRRKKPSCNSSLYSAEVGCWDAKENMLGWGGNQATTRSRSNPRTHPTRLLFPKSDHPPHIPQRLSHVSGQERKKMKPTSTQKIQFSLLPIYKGGNAFKCIPAMIRL